MKKIAVFGNYGVNNLGDDLMLRSILKRIKDLGAQPIIFCGHPKGIQGTSAYHFFPAGIRSGFRWVFSGPYRKAIREGMSALRSCDEVWIGGGGILVDRHFKALLLWWRQLRMIAKSGVPFSFVGNSFELRYFFSQWLFLPFLRTAKSISVRGKVSLRFLEQHGVSGILEKDLAYDVLPNPSGEPPQMSGKAPTIAMSICKSGLGRREQRALRSFIIEKKREGFEVTGLAFQTTGDDDRKILKKIDPEMKIAADSGSILKTLATSQYLIGMRYHSLVLAEHFGVPTLAIPYQQKVEEISAEKGIVAIPLKTLSREKLQAAFREIQKK